ncbi:MAG: GH92 family glycosyl hydrolase, partial [Bacteroidales bacterium]|nr:GH92 family glycosyl hydrolase [Bacteroidales bacterium]
MRIQKPIFIILALFLISCSNIKKEQIDYVDPFIGTGGHGHTFPGASVPFGMVQLSPDTRLEGWDGCSAYHYSDNIVYGFSHTHLSGTGCSDYGDILLMPFTGKIVFDNGYKNGVDNGYASRFKKKNEKASPGYYSTLLDDYNIKVELTASNRAGFHKYTFNDPENAHIIIDLKHRDEVISSSLKKVSGTEICGKRISHAWANNQFIYFVARFSQPFTKIIIDKNDTILNDITETSGKNIKAVLNFDIKKNKPLLVKVGISAVSIEGARKNLDAEIPGWNFDTIKSSSEKLWTDELKKISVQGTEKEKTIFYTALYHSLLAPNTFMDIDRQYRGTDLKIHKAEDFTNYTVFSLWDTYRATHPLFTIIEQKRTGDFIKTFIHQYENGGQLPVWELAGNYTGCMIGYHSIPVICDAYVKGIRNFDVEEAYQAMKHSAMQDHLGLKAYKKYGYIPADKESESVSKTLEYAYDDWCIAVMAKALKKDNDYKYFIKRAQSYKNIFDPQTKFMRPKSYGIFKYPFDPAEVDFNFTEANSWQYSFYVPQD